MAYIEIAKSLVVRWNVIVLVAYALTALADNTVGEGWIGQ